MYLIKRSLIKKVMANGGHLALVSPDYDMENLIPQDNPMEEMDDASSGSYEVLPRKTLRERQYIQNPLMLRPAYKGDFLEMLKNPKNAADPTNIKDFSDPSEMLKHQETTYPRELTDEFIEMNRPGPFIDQILKDYDNRGWDTNEAPEVSEDLIDRNRDVLDAPILKTFKLPFRASQRVVKAFIDKVSKEPTNGTSIQSLMGSRINGKPISWKGVNVTPLPQRSKPNIGLWVYKTGKGSYLTSIQFIPKSDKEENVNNLNLRTSCTCKSWIWYGGQFNAYSKGYLYGPVEPMLLEPNIRDPKREFLACKHILASLDKTKSNKIYPIKLEVKDMPPTKVKLPKDIEVEELRIPGYLSNIKNKPEIKNVLKKWEGMSKENQDEFIKGLESLVNIMYMGYRFPYSAAPSALDQLKLRYKEIGPRETEMRNRVNRAITDFSGFIKRLQHFMNLNRYKMASVQSNEKSIQNSWNTMTPDEKRKYIDSIKEPSEVYAIFLMFPGEDSLSLVLDRLRNIGSVESDEYLKRLL